MCVKLLKWSLSCERIKKHPDFQDAFQAVNVQRRKRWALLQPLYLCSVRLQRLSYNATETARHSSKLWAPPSDPSATIPSLFWRLFLPEPWNCQGLASKTHTLCAGRIFTMIRVSAPIKSIPLGETYSEKAQREAVSDLRLWLDHLPLISPPFLLTKINANKRCL